MTYCQGISGAIPPHCFQELSVTSKVTRLVIRARWCQVLFILFPFGFAWCFFPSVHTLSCYHTAKWEWKAKICKELIGLVPKVMFYDGQLRHEFPEASKLGFALMTPKFWMQSFISVLVLSPETSLKKSWVWKVVVYFPHSVLTHIYIYFFLVCYSI